MQRLNRETALVALELQQFVAEFAYEVDANNSENITDFYAEDAVFAVGDFKRHGHAGVKQFYEEGAAKARAQCKDGIRVRWHTFLNFRYAIESNDDATVYFTNVHYTGEGHPPVVGPINPVMVTDCRMVCRRESDGFWRIRLFDGSPIFVDDRDSITKSALLKN